MQTKNQNILKTEFEKKFRIKYSLINDITKQNA